MDYFGQLSALLKKEREADKRAYLDLMLGTSLSDRRAAGLAWYPVAIRGTEPGRGDYLIVEVERTTHKDLPHQLRFGSAALLFSGENSVEGVISYQGEDRLKLTLRTEELPDWVDDGKLGIDLLFDDNSYEEMFGAMRRAAALAEAHGDGRLVRVLTGSEEPRFTEAAFKPAVPLNTPKAEALNATQAEALNATQAEAVRRILGAEDLAIVHGPPGTGKTTTLVQAIKALIQREPQRVLVTAPSNTAVDLLSERLSAEGLNVLRIGNPARVSERLVALTLDERIGRHPASKEIRGLRRRATEFRDMAHKYKRSFGPAEREQRKALFGEARKIMKEVEQIEKYILDDLLDKAQVIAATLVGTAHYTIRDLSYRTAFIDEAAQALEPACWIPAVKAKTLVLAGDHFQLPPVIKSETGSANKSETGLAETLMEKLVGRYPQAVTLLEEQYRMHPVIMGFPSKIFYENRLVAAPSVPDGENPLLFIDTAGCGFEEKQQGNGLSNPEEAAFLARYLAQFPPEGPVAVISPYRLQVELLKELIHQEGITVNTIDAFQGQERDAVYISMTRSNTDNRIGFLSEIRRMNVAMTRAKRHLVVIGDSATLSQSSFYADFIAYAEAQGGYKSAWEFIQ